MFSIHLNASFSAKWLLVLFSLSWVSFYMLERDKIVVFYDLPADSMCYWFGLCRAFIERTNFSFVLHFGVSYSGIPEFSGDILHNVLESLYCPCVRSSSRMWYLTSATTRGSRSTLLLCSCGWSVMMGTACWGTVHLQSLCLLSLCHWVCQ